MHALTPKQRLALGIGMLVFLVTCLYVPWKMQVWGSHEIGSAGEFTWRPIEPPFTEYGLVFNHLAASMPSGSTMVAELNLQLLLTEWVGVFLLTTGLLWFLKRDR
jgi:hypothetical protein